MMITGERLRRIEYWENGLERFGFTGCRVRLGNERDDVVYVEIDRSVFDLLLASGIRLSILRFFHKSGVAKVFLDLDGR
jgi:PP-loop superfamily ATP-utilizing enzyme